MSRALLSYRSPLLCPKWCCGSAPVDVMFFIHDSIVVPCDSNLLSDVHDIGKIAVETYEHLLFPALDKFALPLNHRRCKQPPCVNLNCCDFTTSRWGVDNLTWACMDMSVDPGVADVATVMLATIIAKQYGPLISRGMQWT